MSNKTVYDYSVRKIDGSAAKLKDYEGKTLLLVNVASKCGLTPQYNALEKIYEKYHAQGFAILGFPANEFGGQEPGTNAEIENFCTANFGVKFPMFEKIVVKGEGTHPLYQFLISEKPKAQSKPGTDFETDLKKYGITRENPSDILWNFEKFLIGRDGKVIARYSPDTLPDDAMVTSAVEAALA